MARTATSGPQIVRNRHRPRPQKGQTAGHAPGTADPRQPASLGPPSLGPSGLPLLRTSERGTFKRCRWKWWLEFHELEKPTLEVPPLRFGSLLHAALASFYRPGVRRGPKPAETFEQLYLDDLAEAGENYDNITLAEAWDEAADLGVVMLERYYAEYGKDDQWKVLVTEYPFRTIVNHPVRGTPWFWYTGILDGVWQDRSTGLKVIPDHKSTRAIQLQYLRMDPQATSYWTFGVDALIRNGILAPDGSEKLDGMLFNFLRKAPRSDKAVDPDGYKRNKPKKADYLDALRDQKIRHNPKAKIEDLAELAARHRIIVLGEISKVQPAPYHARVPVYRDWSERENLRMSVIAEFMDMEQTRIDARRGDVGNDGIPPSVYKNPGQFTCPGCWALDICELHEIGQDWMELREMSTHKWDPYSAHEISEGR